MISDTIQALQTLHKTIPSVNYAPTKYPSALNSSQMVTVLVFPQSGSTEALTSKGILKKTERIYSVRVFIEPVGQNTYDAPIQKGMDLLDSFLEYYINNQELIEGYVNIRSVNDSGVISGGELAAIVGLTFGDNTYRGFVCNLNITEVIT